MTRETPGTTADWLEAHIRACGDRIAYRGPEGSFSFIQLDEQARRLACGLHSLGVGPGDIVAVQLPNGLEFILSYLATGLLGAVLQTIHMPYREAEIEPLLRHGRTKILICLSSIGAFRPDASVLAMRARLPRLEAVIAVGADTAEEAIPFPQVCEMEAPVPEHHVSADHNFTLLFTSGTTAAPKGVMVPYSKFLTNATAAASELEIDAASVLLSAAPFTHLYGLFTLNLAMVTAARTTVLPTFTPTKLADALDGFRPTVLFVAPAHVATLLNEGLFTTDRLASLSVMLISGSTCPFELASAVQKLMPSGKVCQLWGMTEVQAGAFTRPGDPLSVRLSSAGRASPGTALRVANGTIPLVAGQEGELQVRGRSVFSGYLDNEEASAAAFTSDRWFRTGDLARMDRDGNISITGRLKDVINRGGIKFNPVEIEILIDQHPDVIVSAIVPAPDAILGERACCFLVPARGAEITLEDLKEWLASHKVAKSRWPEQLVLIGEMPMTATRKIKKSELRQRLGQRL
jgi:cyclohexanecarboxylate-CoA ligase